MTKTLGDFALWFFGLVVGVYGATMIIEQSLLDLFTVHVDLLGSAFGKISNFLPIISLMLICAGIYFEQIPRNKPTWISRNFIAPTIFLLGAILLGVQIWTGSLAAKYIDGGSLLALSGAIFRIRGFPTEAVRTS